MMKLNYVINQSSLRYFQKLRYISQFPSVRLSLIDIPFQRVQSTQLFCERVCIVQFKYTCS